MATEAQSGRVGRAAAAVRRGSVALLLGATALLAAGVAHAQSARPASGLAVVVHPSTPVADLPLRVLRSIFLGSQQYWPDQSRITLLIGQAGSVERDVTLRRLYDMREDDYKRYWIGRIFRNESTTGPQLVRDAAVARKLVASLPGTIALLPVEAVDESVRILRIDGLLPGEPEYGLR